MITNKAIGDIEVNTMATAVRISERLVDEARKFSRIVSPFLQDD